MISDTSIELLFPPEAQGQNDDLQHNLMDFVFLKKSKAQNHRKITHLRKKKIKSYQAEKFAKLIANLIANVVLGEKERVTAKLSIPGDIFSALKYHRDRKAINSRLLGAITQPAKECTAFIANGERGTFGAIKAELSIIL